MYVLDSSALIELMKNSNKAHAIYKLVNESRVYTTSINIYELLLGLKQDERKKFSQLIDELSLLDFTSSDADKSVEIKQKLEESGNTIHILDIFIASICMNNNKVLVTLDNDFKRVSGLKLQLIG